MNKGEIKLDEIKNALIEGAELIIDEHGFLTVWLRLNYGDSGQGFGGFILTKNGVYSKSGDVAGHFIYRVLEIAGVSDWKDVIGKTIRAKASHRSVSAIGHIINDDWFNPTEDFGE